MTESQMAYKARVSGGRWPIQNDFDMRIARRLEARGFARIWPHPNHFDVMELTARGERAVDGYCGRISEEPKKA